MEDELKRLREVNAVLLAACQEALVALRPNDGYKGVGADACKTLRAAIAKANGTETPLTHAEMVQETLRRC